MGREKMKMKKIEDISARQVSFSKRRQGLFKKARELSTLCDAEVAAIVVSPAGKPHNYASSEIEDILSKFSMQLDKEQHSADFQRENNDGVEHLNSGIDEQMKRLRNLKNRAQELNHQNSGIKKNGFHHPQMSTKLINFAGANLQEMNGSGTGVVVIRNWRGAFMAAQARFLPEQMDEIAVIFGII